MRKSRYSEHQIVGALKRAEEGVPVKDVCRKLGVSPATFYQWRLKYGGLEVSEFKRVKVYDDNNSGRRQHDRPK